MVLKLHKEILIKIGILRKSNHGAVTMGPYQFLIGGICWLTLLLFVISSLVFIMKFNAYDLESTLFAVLQVSAVIATLYSVCVIYFHRHRISTIAEKIEEIQNKDTSKYTIDVNQLADLLTKISVFGMPLVGNSTILGMTLLSGLYSFLKYGFIDITTLYIPQKLVLPWNQNGILGYILTIVYSNIIVTLCLFANLMMMSYFCCLCLQFRVFRLQFRGKIDQLHQILSNTDETKVNKMRIAKLHYTESIKIHINYKRIFAQVENLYSGILFIQSICGTVYIATSIFQLELALRHLDANIGLVLLSLVNGSITLFFYCFSAALATENFLSISDYLYDSPWHELSNSLKQYIILMICNGHLPLCFKGYKMISINLETFQKILQNVFKFYLMFKALTSND